MAITILSPVTTKAGTKAKPKSVGKDSLSRAEELAASIAELSDKLEPIQKMIEPLLASKAEAEAELHKLVDTLAQPDEEYQVQGGDTLFSFGKKGNKTTVTDKNAAALMIEEIKDGLFVELASIGITNLKAYLTPEQIAKVTTTERVSKRSLKMTKVST